MWDWIVNHWVAGGGFGISATGIAIFWGRIMAFLKAWWEAKEAHAKARIAEAGVKNAEREAKVADMIRQIQKLHNETSVKYPGRNIMTQVKPGPNDDHEVFNEAMRRIRKQSAR